MSYDSLEVILLLEFIPSFIQRAEDRCTDHPLLSCCVLWYLQPCQHFHTLHTASYGFLPYQDAP